MKAKKHPSKKCLIQKLKLLKQRELLEMLNFFGIVEEMSVQSATSPHAHSGGASERPALEQTSSMRLLKHPKTQFAFVQRAKSVAERGVVLKPVQTQKYRALRSVSPLLRTALDSPTAPQRSSPAPSRPKSAFAAMKEERFSQSRVTEKLFRAIHGHHKAAGDSPAPGSTMDVVDGAATTLSRTVVQTIEARKKATALSSDGYWECRNLFSRIDEDGNGFLTLSELIAFRGANPRLLPASVFQALSLELDGRVFLDDFIAAHYPCVPKASIESAIEQYEPKTKDVTMLTDATKESIRECFESVARRFPDDSLLTMDNSSVGPSSSSGPPGEHLKPPSKWTKYASNSERHGGPALPTSDRSDTESVQARELKYRKLASSHGSPSTGTLLPTTKRAGAPVDWDRRSMSSTQHESLLRKRFPHPDKKRVPTISLLQLHRSIGPTCTLQELPTLCAARGVTLDVAQVPPNFIVPLRPSHPVAKSPTEATLQLFPADPKQWDRTIATTTTASSSTPSEVSLATAAAANQPLPATTKLQQSPTEWSWTEEMARYVPITLDQYTVLTMEYFVMAQTDTPITFFYPRMRETLGALSWSSLFPHTGEVRLYFSRKDSLRKEPHRDTASPPSNTSLAASDRTAL